MRKKFPCGHSGKGKFCHSCAQKDAEMARERAVKRDRSLAKTEERRRLESAEIDGIHDVPAHVADKAVTVAERLKKGVPVSDFKGKRMMFDRARISIPLGYSYRLLCLDTGAGIQAQQVLSHEDYNRQYREEQRR